MDFVSLLLLMETKDCWRLHGSVAEKNKPIKKRKKYKIITKQINISWFGPNDHLHAIFFYNYLNNNNNNDDDEII